ncbi:MAG TPA: hypothetical protein VD813_13750, partial [Pseudonocardia sp.]|nr:hypothetical protein [Pseudonocardia sp.]
MNAWDVGPLVLWLVVLLNLLLTVALVRRVSALSERPAGPVMSPGGLPAGTPAPDFRATTPEGAERDGAEFTQGRALLGFFSPTCDACYEHAPHFATLGRTAADAGV